MNIKKDHLYHGAALCQIAEHQSCTAINAFKNSTGVSRKAFKVNANIGLYLKYAVEPKGPYSEYVFNFREANLREIEKISEETNNFFIALICVDGREICCLTKNELFDLVNSRISACGGDPERQYTIITTLPKDKNFRVYVNAIGKKSQYFGREIKIARNRFPGLLFE